jgi:uncharacterized membrane protein YphA (DoxX/SURF4 family)
MRLQAFLKNNFADFVSYLLILLFVYAAASKLLNYDNFRVQLGQSPLLTSYAGFVAWFIPVLEIVTAILLMIPLMRMNAFYLSFSLLVMFTAYLIAVIHFSFYVPCTCGGILQNMDWNTHILFNSFFILLTLATIITEPEKIFIAINRGNRKPETE